MDNVHDGTTPRVVVYGSTDCPFTKRVCQWLQRWQVEYHWVDVDDDAAAELQIAQWNDGHAIRPTLDINGLILVNPEHGILQQELKSHRLIEAAT